MRHGTSRKGAQWGLMPSEVTTLRGGEVRLPPQPEEAARPAGEGVWLQDASGPAWEPRPPRPREGGAPWGRGVEAIESIEAEVGEEFEAIPGGLPGPGARAAGPPHRLPGNHPRIQVAGLVSEGGQTGRPSEPGSDLRDGDQLSRSRPVEEERQHRFENSTSLEVRDRGERLHLPPNR